MPKLSAAMARKFLADVTPDVEFWVCDNGRLKNLKELAEALRSMENKTFACHSNKERQDFSNWVNDCIGDSKLAKELMINKSRLSAFRKVNSRLAFLQGMVRKRA